MAHNEHVLGNIFVRPNFLAKVDDYTVGHKHNFDHATFIITGAVKVEALEFEPVTEIVQEFDAGIGGMVEREIETHNNDPKVLRTVIKKAGDYLLIRADVVHRITALEPNTKYLCVFSHRHPDGSVSTEYTGWDDANR